MAALGEAGRRWSGSGERAGESWTAESVGGPQRRGAEEGGLGRCDGGGRGPGVYGPVTGNGLQRRAPSRYRVLLFGPDVEGKDVETLGGRRR